MILDTIRNTHVPNILIYLPFFFSGTLYITFIYLGGFAYLFNILFISSLLYLHSSFRNSVITNHLLHKYLRQNHSLPIWVEIYLRIKKKQGLRPSLGGVVGGCCSLMQLVVVPELSSYHDVHCVSFLIFLSLD